MRKARQARGLRPGREANMSILAFNGVERPCNWGAFADPTKHLGIDLIATEEPPTS